MTVRSPKTAGHAGHAVRFVPTRPTLRGILERLFEAAPEGEVFVIPKLRDPSVNLRSGFERIITRAGEKAWPRLFHNLRAAAASDWAATFPNHVVAKWCGHSPLIAAKHYLHTTDAHFNLAAGLHPETATPSPTKGAAANPAAQARPQRDNNECQDFHAFNDDETESDESQSLMASVGNACDSVGQEKTPAEARVMTPMGFEPMSHP